jgi:hypothetical protein
MSSPRAISGRGRSTLDSVDQWSNSRLIKGSVADFVAELRQQDGGTIGTAGSPSVVRSLIDQGLLDELTLMISPVVAGGGRKRLFADDAMRGWVPSRVMVSNTNGISAPWQAPSRWDGRPVPGCQSGAAPGRCRLRRPHPVLTERRRRVRHSPGTLSRRPRCAPQARRRKEDRRHTGRERKSTAAPA